MIADAPALAGAVNATLRLAFAVVTEEMVGAVAKGLTNESADTRYGLALTSLTVATRKRTVAPGVKPEIDAVVEVDTPSFTQRQVVPPSVDD